MKVFSVAPLVGAICATTVIAFAPAAHAASMKIGNYEVATDRWNDHSFVRCV